MVPHYDDLSRLDRCLDALHAQTWPADRREIIVADNGSPQGEAAVAAAVGGRARLVVVPEKGAGPARNGGAAVARGEVFAFTDADCLPEPGWLAGGVETLRRFDLVGGEMRVLVADEARPSPTESFERVFAFDNRTYVERSAFSVTANLFCRRDVFERVGGFRVGVPEDLDWCRRAAALGFRIGYAEAAVVGHPARETWPALTNKWRRLNAEAFGDRRERPFGRVGWALRAAALPVSALLHTPKVLTDPRLRTPGERAAALGVLWRLRLWRTADALRLLSTR